MIKNVFCFCQALAWVCVCVWVALQVPFSDMAINFHKGPFGGHRLGGDSCPPITFEVPYSNSYFCQAPFVLCFAGALFRYWFKGKPTAEAMAQLSGSGSLTLSRRRGPEASFGQLFEVGQREEADA